ncbi:hypothetical protein Aph01nite_59290 [Acrocarpospora phusangensis]|uniref:Uncharacterized protein n=1 Tax=Acrocarpospora phusangensis TaxID=1070424 RepID=A0A919UN69_9ACTN|nr:hypothetical protein Aph01nite_59290 [Acrocarpospora phusangensis]
MSRTVRVRPASDGGHCAVRHPEHGEHVVPNPAHAFSADDPLVREYPWLFVADPEDGPPLEQATQAPGEKRTTRRAR